MCELSAVFEWMEEVEKRLNRLENKTGVMMSKQEEINKYMDDTLLDTIKKVRQIINSVEFKQDDHGNLITDSAGRITSVRNVENESMELAACQTFFGFYRDYRKAGY